MLKNPPLKETVVILPYHHEKVLLQLRDDKKGIAYPGNWGFFSGTIEPGEEPFESARRELYEEIRYAPKKIYYLSRDCIYTPGKVKAHSFYCPLNIALAKINLCEGYDFGLFSLKQIQSYRLFSLKARKDYPVIKHSYVEYLVKKLLERIGQKKHNRAKK